MKQQIALIRGTGFANLDGSLVTVVEVRDNGFTAVIPHGSKIPLIPIEIDSRCIQEVGDVKKYAYTFVITKERYDEKSGMPLCVESKRVVIENAFRDTTLSTISEYLNSHLKPLLTME